MSAPPPPASKAPSTTASAADPTAAGADDADMLDETPPLLGSWRNIYTVVLLSQVALIALFYGLTRVFT